MIEIKSETAMPKARLGDVDRKGETARHWLTPEAANLLHAREN